MHPEDPLGPVNGIALGLLAGAVLWASIALLCIVVAW